MTVVTDNKVLIKWIGMAEFKSWHSYWDYERSIRSDNRYIYSSDIQEFLDTVLDTSKNRWKKISKNTSLWRAQIGCQEPFGGHGDSAPLPFERMKPRDDQAVEGRANPKGIPYLYLADDKNTAMAEVRPWKGQKISLGEFRVIKKLQVVEFSRNQDEYPIFLGEPPPKEREQSVWFWMDNAFSRPTNASDDVADYAATQIIAELFKNKGADGIMYRSSLGIGHNIMLFDLKSAEIMNCAVYSLDMLHFEFTPEVPDFSKHWEKSDKLE